MALSRRAVLAGLTVTLAAAGCGSDNASTFEPAAAQTAGAAPAPLPTFLYVQSADSGSLSAQGSETFALRLRGAARTLYFSERPARVFGSTVTTDFVAKDFPCFGSDPPNAVLEIVSPAEATVLELLSASVEGDDVVYHCRALPGGAGATYAGRLVPPQGFPASFGPANLFIDSSPGPALADNSAEFSVLQTKVTLQVFLGVWSLQPSGQGRYRGTVTFTNSTGGPLTLSGVAGDPLLRLEPVNVPVGVSQQAVELVGEPPEEGTYKLTGSLKGNDIAETIIITVSFAYPT